MKIHSITPIYFTEKGCKSLVGFQCSVIASKDEIRLYDGNPFFAELVFQENKLPAFPELKTKTERKGNSK